MCAKRLGQDWQAHHRKPRRMGGRAKNRHVNTIANLLALCLDCHARIESQRAWAYQCGYLLYESDDPKVATVLVMGRRRVVLAETYEEV